MCSIVTSKTERWPRFIWPTLYILRHRNVSGGNSFCTNYVKFTGVRPVVWRRVQMSKGSKTKTTNNASKTSSAKIPCFVGRIGLGVRVSASFQEITLLAGRMGSAVPVFTCTLGQVDPQSMNQVHI